MFHRTHTWLFLFAIFGCATKPGVRFDEDAAAADAPSCPSGSFQCAGNVQFSCDDRGQPVDMMTCRMGTTCFSGLGCRTCRPGLTRCSTTPGNEQQIESCNTEGTGWSPGPSCGGDGMTCTSGRCVSRCDESALGRSYLGCDYWPTVTPNNQLGSAFDFAVVLSNPQTYPVNATITGGNLATPRSITLMPGAIETVSLPWVQDLIQRNVSFAGCPSPGHPACQSAPPAVSALRRNGAYHVHTNGPVAAYQFNPLNFRSPEGHASFTNDASLLLPQGVLTRRYIVSTWPNWVVNRTTGPVTIGGFVSVVAVTGETTSVTVRPTTQVSAGSGVATIAPGAQMTFTLQAGDVLQLVGSGAGDLTGTTITSTLPVAVFVGHDCTNVPQSRPACDHLEEQLFPGDVTM
jgi:hypothetical protein